MLNNLNISSSSNIFLHKQSQENHSFQNISSNLIIEPVIKSNGVTQQAIYEIDPIRSNFHGNFLDEYELFSCGFLMESKRGYTLRSDTKIPVIYSQEMIQNGEKFFQ